MTSCKFAALRLTLRFATLQDRMDAPDGREPTGLVFVPHVGSLSRRVPFTTDQSIGANHRPDSERPFVPWAELRLELQVFMLLYEF